ncbi:MULTISPECIES: alpha-amylase family glycosyl hydrolase [unclassified Mycoplasma]|uniref:alpha-amylase family glycosyl hydrolase n=1 Tax=unclassified Mycoplasma TaxID=2683645 RepID=UPI00211BD730|nr:MULTISPECIES: alpha-amylase family glycosyl hydrolase [unclassified Mycoplasma]UUM19739.1 alpha-amylase family glycosyl hydrolase [Mycoplasma sp. 1578d]UUM24723.1 alpha-amylase family glycosyl hydrolase [Mycoplasma sp. 3686d]
MKTIKLEDRIIYQIFPRSFMDSNNDGNGDLKGITSKLDYLEELGINVIWLCPIYATNFVDAGYDVLDYKNVWEQFGTLEDFKELAQQAQKRGIDIIMDIVLNHVSNEHEWFKKAIESTKNVEHNYFIWRDQLTDEEKQAKSIFGGSAWEYVPSINKYYFHLFAKEQVDLNWEHPDTLKAMVEVIDFWYALGVRGFRLDAIKHVSKNFAEFKYNPGFAWCKGTTNYLKEFNQLAFANKPDIFTLGEASGITHDQLIQYAITDKVADNYYNFSWWWIGWGRQTGRNGYDSLWDYKQFALRQKEFQVDEQVHPSMITNFLSNHDTSRSVSRWGCETIFRNQSAKSHAIMLFTLKGVPSIYYGEEIGLLNIHFDNRDQFKDVDTHNSFKNMVDRDKIYTEEEMLLYSNINSRDSGRVTMQWNSSINSGFNTGATPWIKLGRFSDQINVEKESKNPHSILNFYKQIIHLRKTTYHDVLIYGKANIEILDSGIIKITRWNESEKLIAYLNLTSKEMHFDGQIKELILSSWSDYKIPSKLLRPYESVLVKE